MAESFASAIAEKVLSKLVSLSYQELCLAWNVKNDIHELEHTLKVIKTVLFDAEEKQGDNPRLGLWLEELKEVCYDAEDVLDEIDVEALRKRVVKGGSIKGKVRHFFSCSNPVVFNFKVGHKIKGIRERLVKVAADKNDFNLTERTDGSKHVMSNQRETHSFVDASDVIGRDEDKKRVLDLLVSSSDVSNLSVIPIVGIGGLGKTTLAKLVYNDPIVKEYFDLKMWICVSDEFILKKLMIDILKSAATGEKNLEIQRILRDSNNSLDQLQTILRDTLRGKKYLLVIDDVWNEDPNLWNELRCLLSEEVNGSKIIVTTRSDQVASIMGTVPTHKLGGLSHDECMKLFVKCAFKEGQEEQHSNLIEIGKGIVKKCGGVPLAVRTLAGLLYSSDDENYWKRVRDSDIWKLEQKTNGILPALKLSYDHLPSHLKPCFAYCSIFPKDFEFNNLMLISYWMAHGLIQSSDENQDLENIGIQYIKELTSRSFFQDFEDEVYDIFFNFKMHDLIHDLAISLMKSEFAILKSRSESIPTTVRHLTFFDADTLEIDLPTSSPVCHVRSILSLVEGNETSESFFVRSVIPRFKRLRFLAFNDCNVQELPGKTIGDLKHLRFLNLGPDSKIKKLSNSICRLHSLQTLKLAGCEELEELPGDIRHLINLRLLFFTTKQRCLPKNGIGCLNSLRSLIILCCDNLEYLCEDIDRLKVLGTFVIGGCPKLISLPHNMKYLSKLENLLLYECESLVPNLSSESERETNRHDLNSRGPPLRKLVIEKLPKLVELPQWLLQGTLQTLHIKNCSEFKALPEQSVQDLKSLQVLHIDDCPELSSLPENMKHLTTMRELTIKDCPKMTERCKRENGVDWPKIAHIPKIELDGEIIKPSN